jgi:hypothetical protein
MVSCRSGNTSSFFYSVRSDSMGLLLVFLAPWACCSNFWLWRWTSLKKLDFLLALSQRICSPERNCPSRHFLDPAAKSAFATSFFFVLCCSSRRQDSSSDSAFPLVLPLRIAFALVVLAPRSRVRSPVSVARAARDRGSLSLTMDKLPPMCKSLLLSSYSGILVLSTMFIKQV